MIIEVECIKEKCIKIKKNKTISLISREIIKCIYVHRLMTCRVTTSHQRLSCDQKKKPMRTSIIYLQIKLINKQRGRESVDIVLYQLILCDQM